MSNLYSSNLDKYILKRYNMTYRKERKAERSEALLSPDQSLKQRQLRWL